MAWGHRHRGPGMGVGIVLLGLVIGAANENWLSFCCFLFAITIILILSLRR